VRSPQAHKQNDIFVTPEALIHGCWAQGKVLKVTHVYGDMCHVFAPILPAPPSMIRIFAISPEMSDHWLLVGHVTT
jgi:hypothetical protein